MKKNKLPQELILNGCKMTEKQMSEVIERYSKEGRQLRLQFNNGNTLLLQNDGMLYFIYADGRIKYKNKDGHEVIFNEP